MNPPVALDRSAFEDGVEAKIAQDGAMRSSAASPNLVPDGSLTVEAVDRQPEEPHLTLSKTTM